MNKQITPIPRVNNIGDNKQWIIIDRPGMFGKSRDRKISGYNSKYGQGNWRLVWCVDEVFYEFVEACYFYELSYIEYLKDKSDLIDYICGFKEVIDNSMTNIQSGMDYSIQESASTHIQDIAVRRAIHHFGRTFDPNSNRILEVRSNKSSGAQFSPGKIPFFDPSKIHLPSIGPRWANKNSVEDFWQSNKYLQALQTVAY
jgi:hypothetical protein